MPVVEQDGGVIGQEFVFEGGRGDSGGPPGTGTKAAQDGHAGGFAGFFDRRGDVEVGSEMVGSVGVGVKNPESEDDALVLGADQVVVEGVFQEIHDVGGREDRVI